jgi:hypothetical protein
MPAAVRYAPRLVIVQGENGHLSGFSQRALHSLTGYFFYHPGFIALHCGAFRRKRDMHMTLDPIGFIGVLRKARLRSNLDAPTILPLSGDLRVSWSG